MRRLFAVILALSCVAAATPSFARGGMGAGHGGFVRDPDDSPRGTDSAGARDGKPDSCPAGGTGAANRHRWSELTARFPGLDRNWE